MSIEEMIPETDQWKLEGDCAKCRRASYCHDKDEKGCGPIKRKKKVEKKAEAKKKMAEMFGVSEDEIEVSPTGKVIINRKEKVESVEINETPVDTENAQAEE